MSTANRTGDLDYVQSDGSIKYKLVVTLKTPWMSSVEYEQYRMDQFVKKSAKQMHSDLALMLNQTSTADFKIVTSDGIELLVHKAILRGTVFFTGS